MDQSVQHRVAGPDDVDVVTGIVADAFRDDPLWAWALQRADGATDHHEQLWRLFAEGAIPHGATWLAPDDAAVAVWIPPGASELSPAQEDELERRAHDTLGAEGAARYFALFGAFEAHHPHDEPHYYLSLLATARDRRGEGIGMGLLRSSLAILDERGTPSYLESSNPANDARYAAHGYVRRGRFDAPGGGPTVSTMWRPAGG